MIHLEGRKGSDTMSKSVITRLRNMINKIIKIEIVDPSEELDEYVLAYLRNVNGIDSVGKFNDENDCKELRVKLGTISLIELEGQVRAAIVKYKKKKEQIIIEA